MNVWLVVFVPFAPVYKRVGLVGIIVPRTATPVLNAKTTSELTWVDPIALTLASNTSHDSSYKTFLSCNSCVRLA